MQKIELFTVKGIPVGFQPMFLLLILILSINMGDIVSMLCFAVCAVLGVFCHEMGHALVARHYHLNPEIVLHGFGGITIHAKGSAKQEFQVTLMGPLANLILGGMSYGLLTLMMNFASPVLIAAPFLFYILQYMMWVNIAWGIFNLIPAIPMDGSKVLRYFLDKKCSPAGAAKTSVIISFAFLTLIIAYSVYVKSLWMILISVMFVMSNISEAKNAFSMDDGGARKLSGGSKQLRLVNLEAEKAYERGLLAAREHNWEALEVCGHQMKRAANDADQLGRAYELLTIACTNLKKYDEAIGYSERAVKTDSVKQAVARCEAMLKTR